MSSATIKKARGWGARFRNVALLGVTTAEVLSSRVGLGLVLGLSLETLGRPPTAPVIDMA